MTKREIAALACKVLALYALLQALRYTEVISFLLGLATGDLEMEAFAQVLIAGLIPCALYLAAAAWLWRSSDVLAARMSADARPGQDEQKVTSLDLHAIAFSVLGMFLLVGVIRQVARMIPLIAHNITIPETDPFGRTVAVATLSNFVALFVQLALGLGLLFGARGLARIVRTVRTAGHKKNAPPGDEGSTPA